MIRNPNQNPIPISRTQRLGSAILIMSDAGASITVIRGIDYIPHFLIVIKIQYFFYQFGSDWESDQDHQSTGLQQIGGIRPIRFQF